VPQLARDAFDADDLACVYVAATLREARVAEAVLTAVGVDYVVDVEEIGTTLFGSRRHGAAFYVASAQAAYSGTKLVSAGLGLGVVIQEDDDRPENGAGAPRLPLSASSSRARR
jgi:hypothetical protein